MSILKRVLDLVAEPCQRQVTGSSTRGSVVGEICPRPEPVEERAEMRRLLDDDIERYGEVRR